MSTLNEVVEAYVECGNKIGFMRAEMILLKYLPKHAPDGKCHDMPVTKRSGLLRDLKNATEKLLQRTGRETSPTVIADETTRP